MQISWRGPPDDIKGLKKKARVKSQGAWERRSHNAKEEDWTRETD